MLTLGKPIAGGVPAAVYGFTEDINVRFMQKLGLEDADSGGIGGTLAGNALSISAMRAALEQVLTPSAYEHMIALGERFEQGVVEIIEEYELPWIVKRLGGRVEYWFRPAPPRSGGEAAAAKDDELDKFMHLFALNRRILMTPFHNMALMSPETSEADVDCHTAVFREAIAALVG
jgi:glutamate-1-semialdehyde 2,1-aminomutase